MIYLTYLWLVLRHKWFVLVAGLRLGHIPLWRLVVHDWSKFSRAEFGAYARNTAVRHGRLTRTEASDLEFAQAWLHHENHNPHHWGYWIPRSGKYMKRPLPMPLTYIYEMLADLQGASRTYEGTWDMSAWLDKQLPGIVKQMHPETATAVLEVLRQLGYGDLIDVLSLEGDI